MSPLAFFPAAALADADGLADVIGGQSWYGHNLDALWDVLTGEPHRGERFLLALPREDDEVYAYALRIRGLFAEAGALCGG